MLSLHLFNGSLDLVRSLDYSKLIELALYYSTPEFENTSYAPLVLQFLLLYLTHADDSMVFFELFADE